MQLVSLIETSGLRIGHRVMGKLWLKADGHDCPLLAVNGDLDTVLFEGRPQPVWCIRRNEALHLASLLHRTPFKTEVRVTRNIFNKINGLINFATPVTPVTRHFNVSAPLPIRNEFHQRGGADGRRGPLSKKTHTGSETRRTLLEDRCPA